ncbi:hypothetical protein N0V88_007418 [Collariella sp. IMI 366227]|nr:hypothetical protein N0V88_007418 [Collariella sp. IMI 366227]
MAKMDLFKKAAGMYFKSGPVGYIRFAPYILIIPIIIFHALSLTGCVSTAPAIPNIYVVDLRANNNLTTTDDPVKVRIGYYGICGVDPDGTRCMSTNGRSVADLTVALFPALATANGTLTNTNTTINGLDADEITDIVTTAVELQGHTFISVLAAAAILFLLGVVALILYKRDVKSHGGASWERRRGRIVRRATYSLLCGSTALVFAAALATTQSAASLEFAGQGMKQASVFIKSGTTLQVLQWMIFGFQVAFAGLVPLLVREKKSAGGGGVEGEA